LAGTPIFPGWSTNRSAGCSRSGRLSFVARLVEHDSEDEIDEGLVQPADDPVLAYRETFREVLDTDRLATLMDEKIPLDIELRLIRDQTESLNRQGMEELERRVAGGR
jgi:hypothetical protein